MKTYRIIARKAHGAPRKYPETETGEYETHGPVSALRQFRRNLEAEYNGRSRAYYPSDRITIEVIRE